jgi:hypothetical protein
VSDHLTLFDAGGLARIFREWLMAQGVDVGDVFPHDPNDALYAEFIAIDMTGYGYLVRIRPTDSDGLE